MEAGRPEPPGDGPRGRGIDVAVWVLVAAAILGFAAGLAWLLSNSRFELREVTYPDEPVEEIVTENAPLPSPAPAPAPSPIIGPNAEVVRPPPRTP